jgi:Rrf2 family transcriptional regulator, iron-sulfur cluster assembly transcription factor
MRLTTKGRVAVAAMIDLGLRQHRGPVTLAGISQRQKISLSYLEQLFANLKHHGLVASTRGPGGGYRLGKPAESVSVADIVFAVDETRVHAQAGGDHGDGSGQSSVTQELWARLNRQMLDFLDSVSLRDLLEQQQSSAAVALTARRSGDAVRGEAEEAVLVAPANWQRPGHPRV